MTFHDHFSDGAEAYRAARPTYPEAVFDWIADASPSRSLVWDCACGNGQASVPLAARFEQVIATDASQNQISEATAAPNIEYRVALAEDSGLPAQSFDAVTVAQAAHWFDADAFALECERVLKPGGLLAYISYGVCTISPEVDVVAGRFYTDIIGPYWPAERQHVDDHYSNLPFPFERVETPPYEITLDWSLGAFVAYLRTWSATKRYSKAHGTDPIGLVWDELHRAWGDPDRKRRIVWPLTVVAGYSGLSSGS